MEYKEIRAEILRGAYDNHLVDIAAALNERMTSDDGPGTSWRVQVDGQEMTEADMTVAEAVQIERLTGNTWVTTAPLASAEITQAFLVVTLMRGGKPSKAALEQVAQMAASEMVDCCDRYQTESPTSPDDA